MREPYFTADCTEGFTQTELDLLNAAHDKLMSEENAYGTENEDDHACWFADRLNNNWLETGNTIETLTRPR